MIQNQFNTNNESLQEVKGFFCTDNKPESFFKSIKVSPTFMTTQYFKGIILYPDPEIVIYSTPMGKNFMYKFFEAQKKLDEAEIPINNRCYQFFNSDGSVTRIQTDDKGKAKFVKKFK